MRLIVLELFAGTRSISKTFEEYGHKSYSVEWDKDFDDITLYADINTITADDVVKMCGRVPDVIWASPDCSTYSIAAISHHRVKNLLTGSLEPVSDYAKFCDKTNKQCHERAPRGAKTGTQGLKGAKARAVIPHELCKHIVKICEE